MSMSKIKTLIARHKTIWLIFFAVITFLMVILNVSSRYGQDNELMYFYMPPPFYQLDSESLVCDPILAIINGKEIDQSTFGLGVFCKEDTSQTVFYTDLLVEDPNLNNDYIYDATWLTRFYFLRHYAFVSKLNYYRNTTNAVCSNLFYGFVSHSN